MLGRVNGVTKRDTYTRDEIRRDFGVENITLKASQLYQVALVWIHSMYDDGADELDRQHK